MTIIQKLLFWTLWGITYTVSLLPRRVFYFFSDVCAFFLNLLGYRRSVIDINMARSFPQLKYGEIKKLRKEYYKYMMDITFESIWAISATQKEISEVVYVPHREMMDELCSRYPKIVVMMGHMGNWELFGGVNGPLGAEGTGGFAKHDIYMSYKRAKNKVFDAFFVKMRMLVSAKCGNKGGILESKHILRHILKDKGATGLYYFIADQSPKEERIVAKFLNQPTQMLAGAEYLASKLGIPMVYLGMDRVARGKYEINFKLIEENTKGLPHGELTRKFACYLQEDIFANKVNWLWSHKRWKRDFREEEIVEYERLYGEKPFGN
ncbi:MAG: lysophospholipid acyltransferase family protein [Bacteroidales bacterium]|nr:lysophospholipid acyltransferase family protein [Bacteroidales bacterium]